MAAGKSAKPFEGAIAEELEEVAKPSRLRYIKAQTAWLPENPSRGFLRSPGLYADVELGKEPKLLP